MNKNKLDYINQLLEARDAINDADRIYRAMYRKGELSKEEKDQACISEFIMRKWIESSKEEKDHNHNLSIAHIIIDKELRKSGVETTHIERDRRFHNRKLIIDGKFIRTL